MRGALKASSTIARALSDDVWVVAPHEEQSGAARALTLANPIRVREIRPEGAFRCPERRPTR